MPARRTLAHGPQGGWSAIALHFEAAEPPKEGFYLTLFPDGKPPAIVYLRAHQVAQLLDMAASSTVTDTQLWDAVARVPLEPLLPSRSLAAKLRALLIDSAAAIRELVKEQAAREPPPSPVEAEPAVENEPSLPPANGDPFNTGS
jgi:hypothetical protein